jgi:hypothetical protein
VLRRAYFVFWQPHGQSAKFPWLPAQGKVRLTEQNSGKIFLDFLRAASKTASARTAARPNHPSFGEKSRNPSRNQTTHLEKVPQNVKIRFRARLRKIRPGRYGPSRSGRNPRRSRAPFAEPATDRLPGTNHV